MKLIVRKSQTSGTVFVPGSKSHTIRAVFMASLAKGKSKIISPLISDDAFSAANTCTMLGAEFEMREENMQGKNSPVWYVRGVGNNPRLPEDVINVGNSGTTLRFALPVAALIEEGCSIFTGDSQIRRRPLGPLVQSMNDLGAQAFFAKGNGCAPVIVKGVLKGGNTSLDSVTSQFLSSLLITCPILQNDTNINVTRLNEVPYVEMTLWWLRKLGIEIENNNLKTLFIPGKQSYSPFECCIPGDFSSATFFIVQAAISGSSFTLKNLDMTDPQGDKRVIEILNQMGAEVVFSHDGITVTGTGKLKAMEIDMNDIPDALPAMAVAGCFAEGETRLVNVPQARMKETDRIHVMKTELSKMGADIVELNDGLIIKKSKLKGCHVNGHGDHRVVMALAVAALNAEGETIIDTAEAMSVTFPEFTDIMIKCGAGMELAEKGDELK